MKRLVMTALTVLLIGMQLMAQVPKQQQQQFMPEKFSPEKFQAELEQYITKEAGLTPQESAKFFPIFREMQKKQRAIYDRDRQVGWMKPTDEQGCQKAIRQRDENELELKRIQQTYHNRMLSIVSGSKLFDVIQAEDRFYRMKFRNWGHRNRPMSTQKRGK